MTMEIQGGVMLSAAGNVAASVIPAPADDPFGDAAKAVFLWTVGGAVCAVLLGLIAVFIWNGVVSIFEDGASWSMLLSGLVALLVALAVATVLAAAAAMSRVNTGTALDYLGELFVAAILVGAVSVGAGIGRKAGFPSRY